MQTKLLDEIHQVLNSFSDYWDRGTLLKNKVIDDLRDYNPQLIDHLLANSAIRDAYTITISNGVVFKIEEFISMLRFKNYWDNSYTKFSNEIGLTNNNKYLKYNSDVVLDFPHKDGILEGGMTKEDLGKQEIYYHNVLAREEIDVLLSSKVLSEIKRYDSTGESIPLDFGDTENLILKGNNLIGLSVLKKRYAKKIKLIYIDPPYNTTSGSFKYNDKFNHSTWLTFMKNRLEIAKELLTDDGSIWINIDDDEHSYLKVLCDEIFGRENFVSNIVWQKKYSPQNDAIYFSDMHDFLLVYARNKRKSSSDTFGWSRNLLPRTEEQNSRYKNPDNDPRGPWKVADLTSKTKAANHSYPITAPNGKIHYPSSGRQWAPSLTTFKRLLADNRIWFGVSGNNVPSQKVFLTEVQSGTVPNTIWFRDEVGHNQEATQELKKLFNDSVFETPKPERLVQRIIQLGTNEGDIVLDFFMGSATTPAVAMKMKRQFIGIEQMDYINTVSVPRLREVIVGEQGGVSVNTNWTGGGSFVYAELKELNHAYISKIINASTENELDSIMQEMLEKAYFDYKLNLAKLTNESSEFNTLSLEDKKQILIDSLDKNQLYLSYSEIDDIAFNISDQTKEFNHSFYLNGKPVMTDE